MFFLHPSWRTGEASSCQGRCSLLLRTEFLWLCSFCASIEQNVCRNVSSKSCGSLNVLQWRDTADNGFETSDPGDPQNPPNQPTKYVFTSEFIPPVAAFPSECQVNFKQSLRCCKLELGCVLRRKSWLR